MHTTSRWTPELIKKKNEVRSILEQILGWTREDGANLLVELRVPNHPDYGTVRGYYDKPDLLADTVAALDGQANIHITLNEINPALAGRAYNHVDTFAKAITQDADILRRRYMLIACSPIRPAGVSVTEEEHRLALDRGREIHKWLRNQLDWKSILAADSGNECQLLVPLDIAPDMDHSAEEDKRMVENCLKYLHERFGDGAIRVDTTTANASTIFRLPGTLAVEGDNLPERPLRRSALLYVPKMVVPLKREDLMRLADRYQLPTALTIAGSLKMTDAANGGQVQEPKLVDGEWDMWGWSDADTRAMQTTIMPRWAGRLRSVMGVRSAIIKS